MIYWLTTNLWTTGQGFVTRKLMPKPVLPTAEKKSSRTPPKDAPEPAAGKANGPGAKDGAKDGAPVVAGPPRRVKRKRSGGGRRR